MRPSATVGRLGCAVPTNLLAEPDGKKDRRRDDVTELRRDNVNSAPIAGSRTSGSNSTIVFAEVGFRRIC